VLFPFSRPLLSLGLLLTLAAPVMARADIPICSILPLSDYTHLRMGNTVSSMPYTNYVVLAGDQLAGVYATHKEAKKRVKELQKRHACN
jgi:hypothetical protein